MPINITFLINIVTKSDFAKFSNFISKVLQHHEITKEESDVILYLRGTENDGEIGGSKWRYKMLKEYENWKTDKMSRFHKFNDPSGISKLNERFHVAYLLIMDEVQLSEISQYKELILLHKAYEQADLYSIIKGENDLYFKLSQYLSLSMTSLNLRDKIFYYRNDKGTMFRLQTKALQATNYLPLIIINEDNAGRLKCKCEDFLEEEHWMRILDDRLSEYKQIQGQIEWKELGGIIRLFLNKKKVLAELPKQEVLSILRNLDVLALALLAYSLDNLADTLNLRYLSEYADMQQQYADACHQLIENILFHSVSKWGILSIRMHKFAEQKENSYLQQAYKLEEQKGYFEVCICDFAGHMKNRNIAQTFMDHLDEREQNWFANIRPENLFKSALGEKDAYTDSWQKYYRDFTHFGKHVGLRIFQSITNSNDGIFIAQSHATHICDKGDVYCHHTSSVEEGYVMPGTAYNILFPLNKSQSAVGIRDISQEYGDWLNENPERLLKLRDVVYTNKIYTYQYDSQEEKNNEVTNLANTICAFFKENEGHILTINAADIRIDQVEIWVKGLILAAYQLRGERHFVFSLCDEVFIRNFHRVMCEIYKTVQCDMFKIQKFQIALISTTYEQIVYMPGNMELADAINHYYSRIKGMKCPYLLDKFISEDQIQRAVKEFIPFDTLTRAKEGGQSFFEEYVFSVLKRDIQREEFGCQITRTHMRLGSTIHIDQFYEGEVLFSSRYCVSRFAFLMLKDMYEELTCKDKITLYGYASYSETLLVTLQSAISALKGNSDTDYIILEREEEHRGMPHADHIRYNINESRISENDQQKRAEYMRERHYVIVVPINSTLKTHQRLISLLKEDNGQISDSQILRNYALILVGPEKSEYWERVGENELKCKYDIVPRPKYFVSVLADYKESLSCDLCFPENTLHEVPLIEVNAASTIPNQSFGIIRGKQSVDRELDRIPKLIDQESTRLKVLEECLIYGHLQRNETHFLYYVQTEKLVIQAANEISQSLKLWKQNMIIKADEYHVIVTPSHFSNCRFSEMVNGEVFGGMATILRIDFNKEYRGNAYVKYSNIRQYIRQIEEMNANTTIKFHYVDDNIITGRTYFRARSIMESIVDQYNKEKKRVDTVIFDHIFTLLDRNSPRTRMQYVKKGISIQEIDKYFYFFIHLDVSSLRNYGDSCIVCNLHKESQHLRVAAATGIVADYWKKSSDDKFRIRSLAEAVERRNSLEDWRKEEFKKRSFRRLLCSHIIKYVLDTVGYDNQTVLAAKILLRILTEDYMRWEEKECAFEYFISYIKTASRPFIVYIKAVKEAIYDILLIIIEHIIKDKKVKEIVAERGNKEYWIQIQPELIKLEEIILNQLSDKQRREVVLVIMKQLTEMKSNYIIRLENMNMLFNFSKKSIFEVQDEENFWTRYVILIKKLIGISSDTSKSLWLDYALLYRKELKYDKYIPITDSMNHMFRQIIILENTSAFQDGIRKIYLQIRKDEMFWKEQILPLLNKICRVERNTVVAAKYFDHWQALNEERLRTQNVQQIMDELLMNLSFTSFFSPGKAEEAYENESKRQEILQLASKMLHSYREIEEKVDYAAQRVKLEEVTAGYQFSNFIYLMSMLGWYNDEEGFTTVGIAQITGSLLIKYLCENTMDYERTLLERIEDLAKVAGWVLGDIPVKIWVEYSDSSEYYKEVIREKFGQRVSICTSKEVRGEKERLEAELFRTQKHFHIIGDNVGHIVTLDAEGQRKLNKEEVYGGLEKYGYFYDHENFVWKIGRNSKYPIYLSARLIQDDENEDDIIYRIRDLLSLASDIEGYLDGKQNYFHETELANSRLNVLERDKSISHTNEKNRNDNFKRIVKGQAPKKDNTLVLLADLNVSRIYRHSLNKAFYLSSPELTGMRWDDENSLLTRAIEEEMHGSSAIIEIRNRAILEEERMLEEDELIVIRDREQELMSLLLAMILNVKEKGRGKEDREHRICVYINKAENGMLHILNETDCEETVLQRVKECLEQEPISEESGITIWTLNSYIKKIKVAYAERVLSKMTGGNINKISEILNRLTSEEFEIKVVIREVDHTRYFLYELPVLRQQYMQLENDGVI